MTVLTKYYQNALEVRIPKKIRLMTENTWELSALEAQRGVIDVSVVSKLFERGKLNPQIIKKSSEGLFIDVLIVPQVVITGKMIRGEAAKENEEEKVGIFYIPAKLYYTGELKVHKKRNKFPWFAKEYLSPNVLGAVQVGNVMQYDTFIDETYELYQEIKDWKMYWEYCEQLFRTVTSQELGNMSGKFGKQKIEQQNTMYLIVDQSEQDTCHIANLYQHIIEDNVEKPLYERVVSQRTELEEPAGNLPRLEFRKNYCGHMNKSYGLSDDQRAVIEQLNYLENGEVMAINGTKGAGKKTVIQSIIANVVVKRALERADAPILVLAEKDEISSINMQKDFSFEEQLVSTVLEKRWIKGVSSFATYFPNDIYWKSKKTGRRKMNNSGYNFISTMEEEENIKISKEFFLKNYREYKNLIEPNLSLSMCEEQIWKELKRVDIIREDLITDFEELKKIIGEKTIEEKKKELFVYNQELVNQMQECKEKIACNLTRRNNARKRIEEWEEIYNKLPSYVRLLSWTPKYKEQVFTQFRIFKEHYELPLLEGDILFEEIKEKYSNYIEENNLRVTEGEEELQLLEEKQMELKNILLHIEEYLKKIASNIEELKILKIDLLEMWDGSLDEYLSHLSNNSFAELLDQRVRFQEFWLSIHYYECRWLLVEEALQNHRRAEDYQKIITSLYQRVAMITPCLIMNIYSLPKEFQIYNTTTNKNTYLYNFIDFLILNQAGELSPEVSIASFSLAKKAIVIGEDREYATAWSISKGVDRILALQLEVIETKAEYDKLIKMGKNCAKSNILHLIEIICNNDKIKSEKQNYSFT